MIEVINESDAEVDEVSVAEQARFVLDRLRIHPQAELSIMFVDEIAMTDLHVTWMDEPGPDRRSELSDGRTAAARDDEPPVEGLLGDIVICPQVAALAGAEGGSPGEARDRHPAHPWGSAPARLRPCRAGRGGSCSACRTVSWPSGTPWSGWRTAKSDDRPRHCRRGRGRRRRAVGGGTGDGGDRNRPGQQGESRGDARRAPPRRDQSGQDRIRPGPVCELAALPPDRAHRGSNVVGVLRPGNVGCLRGGTCCSPRSSWAPPTSCCLGGSTHLGQQRSLSLALSTAGLASALTRLLRPITSLLILIGNAVTRGRASAKAHSRPRPNYELLDRAGQGGRDRTRRATDDGSVLELGDTLVRELMVPRIEMVWIERNKRLRQAMSLSLRSGFSRIPVIGEDLDDIVGVVHVKDLMQRIYEDDEAEGGRSSPT